MTGCMVNEMETPALYPRGLSMEARRPVFSLFMPRLREGRMASPKPMTGGRQVMLVALIVIIGGYPAARWLADKAYLYFADSTVETIAADATLIAAIRAQNLALQGQSQQAIDLIDRQWIEERKNPNGALTSALLASAPSHHLISLVGASRGSLTHAILMDERGRNVAIVAPTTDYWQGDEAKFIETAGKNSTDIQHGDIEKRHDGKGLACWVSRTIFADGKPIGAIAVEVNLQQVPRSFCAAIK
jgi:hypothetical protein